MADVMNEQRDRLRLFYRLRGPALVSYMAPVAPPAYFKVRQYRTPTVWVYAKIGASEAAFEDPTTSKRWAQEYRAQTGRHTEVYQVQNGT